MRPGHWGGREGVYLDWVGIVYYCVDHFILCLVIFALYYIYSLPNLSTIDQNTIAIHSRMQWPESKNHKLVGKYTRETPPGCPGGGTQGYKGAAPALRIPRRKGSFLRPPHVRNFVKEGYFFVPRCEEWGSKIPLRNIRGFDA